MKSIWIFILISIIANIIGAQGKAKKKKTIASPVKNANFNNIDKNTITEAKDNYNTTSQGIGYEEESFLYKAEEEAPMQVEAVVYTEEIFDIGLSELQHAIVVAEILNKPLALRNK